MQIVPEVALEFANDRDVGVVSGTDLEDQQFETRKIGIFARDVVRKAEGFVADVEVGILRQPPRDHLGHAGRAGQHQGPGAHGLWRRDRQIGVGDAGRDGQLGHVFSPSMRISAGNEALMPGKAMAAPTLPSAFAPRSVASDPMGVTNSKSRSMISTVTRGV